MVTGWERRLRQDGGARIPDREPEDPAGETEQARLEEELAPDHRGVAPSALRSPISRTRSVTETSMMFMTPMPPTSNEIAAIPPSRTVRMWSVLVAVSTSDCWLLMVKSASPRSPRASVSSAALASW